MAQCENCCILEIKDKDFVCAPEREDAECPWPHPVDMCVYNGSVFQRPAFCQGCYKGLAFHDPLPAEAQRCGKCRNVWYCDTTCQEINWDYHKFRCDEAQALRRDAKELLRQQKREHVL